MNPSLMQLKAINAVVNGKTIFVTGGAGYGKSMYGKSMFSNMVSMYLQSSNLKVTSRTEEFWITGIFMS